MRPKIINHKTINHNRWYTIADISRLGQRGIFPVKDKRHIKYLIETKKLKAIDVGTKTRKAFRILGDALIEFVHNNNPNKK